MPGKTNLANVLSRLLFKAQSAQKRNIAEEYIHFITQKAVPKSTTLEQLSKATYEDATLQQLQQRLLHNQWSTSPDIQQFFRVQNGLSTCQGLLLRGTRIVMPECLRRQTLSLAHENHHDQGIVRFKQLLRLKMWQPSMDTEAETLIKECIPCQSTMPPSPPLTATSFKNTFEAMAVYSH